jgi:hypothetical protein
MVITIIAVVLGVLTVNFAALYWKGLRDARGLSEYVQHLLMHPEAYEDHRRKFVAYLGGTKSKTSDARSIDAAKALARIADNMRGQLLLANVASRNDEVAASGGAAPDGAR